MKFSKREKRIAETQIDRENKVKRGILLFCERSIVARRKLMEIYRALAFIILFIVMI